MRFREAKRTIVRVRASEVPGVAFHAPGCGACGVVRKGQGFGVIVVARHPAIHGRFVHCELLEYSQRVLSLRFTRGPDGTIADRPALNALERVEGD